MADNKQQPCVMCRSEISVKSKKCKTCGEYQSFFRRLIGFSSTVLALLIALVSVLLIFIPVLSGALQKKQDDVRLVMLAVANEEDAIVVYATNNGGRHAAIRKAVLIPDAMTIAKSARGPKSLQIDGAMLLLPNSGREIWLRGEPGVIPERVGILDEAGSYSVIIEVVHYDGKVSEYVLDFEAKY